jgi:hypothetical protein
MTEEEEEEKIRKSVDQHSYYHIMDLRNTDIYFSIVLDVKKKTISH